MDMILRISQLEVQRQITTEFWSKKGSEILNFVSASGYQMGTMLFVMAWKKGGRVLISAFAFAFGFAFASVVEGAAVVVVVDVEVDDETLVDFLDDAVHEFGTVQPLPPKD